MEWWGSEGKLAAYRYAIHAAFGNDVDYGRIVKRYKVEPASFGRYSPPVVVGVEKDVVYGDPDVDKMSTSIVERSNLTMRTQIRRMTRLTLGFSKRVESLQAAINLHCLISHRIHIVGCDAEPFVLNLPKFSPRFLGSRRPCIRIEALSLVRNDRHRDCFENHHDGVLGRVALGDKIPVEAMRHPRTLTFERRVASQQNRKLSH